MVYKDRFFIGEIVTVRIPTIKEVKDLKKETGFQWQEPMGAFLFNTCTVIGLNNKNEAVLHINNNEDKVFVSYLYQYPIPFALLTKIGGKDILGIKNAV